MFFACMFMSAIQQKTKNQNRNQTFKSFYMDVHTEKNRGFLVFRFCLNDKNLQ